MALLAADTVKLSPALHVLHVKSDDIEMQVDRRPVYTDSSLEPLLLLCPPQNLVECIFPDAFIFPPYAPVSDSLHSRLPSVSRPTINTLFNHLCEKGLHAGERWTGAPDLCDQHRQETEQVFAAFLNTLVTEAVAFMDEEGISPFKMRNWSADSALGKLPGSPENRKPDLIAIDTDSKLDWRSVDSILEMKSGKPPRKEFMAQISERARMIFSLQDDRRWCLWRLANYLS